MKNPTLTVDSAQSMLNLFQSRIKLPAWRQQSAKPVLAHRVVHIDLKGPKIPFLIFKRLLGQYARWGINGVLVEYEQRLPELPLPNQFSKADRYTRSQVGALVNLARDLGIEFIPLVQTLGHVEYLSRLPGTSALAENPKYPDMLCPSQPAARNYLTQLIDLVADLHPHSKRIHVGMDETNQLGHCPICQRRVKALGGKMELYVEQARWICGEVTRHGRTPIIWGDMFLNNAREDLIVKLGRKAIVLPWDYECVTERVPYVLYKGARPCKSVFRHDYTCASLGSPLPPLPAAKGFADDLSTSELARVGGLDHSTGLALGFAQGRLMANLRKKLKCPLWGTCAAELSGSGPIRPNFARGLHNCNQMVRILLKVGGEGAIAAAWARGHSYAPINSPWTLSLYAVAQFAASAWTGRTEPFDLQKRAVAVAAELGMPARIGDWTLDDLLWTLSKPCTVGPSGKVVTLQRALELLRQSKAKGVFAEALVLSIEIEILFLELLFLIEEGRWWYPNKADVPPVIAAEMKTRLTRIQGEIDRLKPRAGRYYTRWIGEKSAFETWWRGLFVVNRELAEKAVALVKVAPVNANFLLP